MGWQIHFDEATQTAMLVDPAGPWALGPSLVGPSSRDTLEAFVDGLDQDPAELTTWELATTWQQFLALMGQVADNDRVSVVEDAEGVAEPVPGPDDRPLEPDPYEGAGGTAVMEAGRDEPPPPAPAEPESWPPCPNCHSTKREAKPGGAMACATCGEPLT